MASATDIAKLADVPIENVTEVFEAIFRYVRKGEQVNIRNFGTFKRAIHKGRTQKTGLEGVGEITYPDRYVFRFTSGKTLKERINRTPPGAKKKKKKGSKKKGKKAARA